jgi:hypothetical protein
MKAAVSDGVQAIPVLVASNYKAQAAWSTANNGYYFGSHGGNRD